MGNVFVCRKLYVPFLLAPVICFVSSQTVEAKDRLEELATQVGVRILAESTSDHVVRDRCKQQIPYGKMSESAQRRAADLIAGSSQYRRMPCLQYEVNPNIYQYLLNHPDVAVSTWRAMGISKLQMSQTGDFEYEAQSGDGSDGIAHVLWRDGNQCVFIVEGSYKSPLLPKTINASALVWLRYRFIESNEGTTLVNQQVETFLYFPSMAVDTIAKLATSVTNTILDRNVFEVSLYARMMSKAAEKEPEWIEQLALRMDGVPPQRRMELVQISRGKKPTEGHMLPVATRTGEQKRRRLQNSGAFRSFETSLHHLNTHVPLVAREVEHQPSYGKKIGDGNPLMAKPMEYMPTEARKALAEQEESRQRARRYNEYYANPDAKGVPQILTPNNVPPADSELYGKPRATVGALMTSPTPLAFSKYSRNRLEDRKASSGVLAPDSTETKRTGTVSSRKDVHPPSRPLNPRAWTVSSSKPVRSTTASKPQQTQKSRRVPIAAAPLEVLPPVDPAE